jgi:hypothetical protein
VEPDEAEQATAVRLRGWGYDVEKLTRSDLRKTADFRARAPGESWVLDVKSRQADYRLENEIAAAGEMREVARRPEAEKSDARQLLALDHFKKAEKQVEATREPGELGAMWLLVSRRLGMGIDPEQLRCSLFGFRQIFFRRKLRPVYAVYPPEFGKVIDLVMIQHVDGKTEALLNPWTDDDRIAATRASLLVRSADRVHDPKRQLDEDLAWLAPEESEARRLAGLHLDDLGSPRDVDRFEGRARRDWQVELALAKQYGHLGAMGGLIRMVDFSAVQFIADE